MTSAPNIGDVYASEGMVVDVHDGDVTLLGGEWIDPGTFGVLLRKLRMQDMDGDLLTAGNKGHMHRAVRQIGRHLGGRQGGYVSGYDREMFDLMVRILDWSDAAEMAVS